MIGHCVGYAAELGILWLCPKHSIGRFCTSIAYVAHEGIVEPLIDGILYATPLADKYPDRISLIEIWQNISWQRIAIGTGVAALVQKSAKQILKPLNWEITPCFMIEVTTGIMGNIMYGAAYDRFELDNYDLVTLTIRSIDNFLHSMASPWNEGID